jgi:hypothetical protein
MIYIWRERERERERERNSKKTSTQEATHSKELHPKSLIYTQS